MDEETDRRTDDTDEACPHDEKEDAGEVQKGESKVSSDSTCYSVQYKITVDLRETTSADCPQHVMDNVSSGPDDTEFNTWEAPENSEVIAQSPIFSKRWQHRFRFSSEGATLKRPGSDVILQVPAGAIEVNTTITVYSAICANDVYVKQKLDLSATETVVSPLAEFWAGPDFRFKKHVQVTLPTCLDSDCDVSRVHVYCINSETPDGKMIVSKLERWDELPQTTDRTTPEAYFYVNENRQVHVMTTHFSGYVCTYCGRRQNIQLEVYASHEHRNGSVDVSLMAFLGDKLQVQDFFQPPEASRRVHREVFQLRETFQKTELHVELALNEKELTKWQFTQTPERKKAFGLNWDEADCGNCKRKVKKYTELGLFCHSWNLESTKCEQEALPRTLKVLIDISHVHEEDGEIQNLTAMMRHLPVNVQPHTEDVNRPATGHQENTSVAIGTSNGDVYIGCQIVIQNETEQNGCLRHNEDGEETSLKKAVQNNSSEIPVTPENHQHNSENREGTI